MDIGSYRLLTQLGAGADGVAYKAELADGTLQVELRVLSGARRDAEHWGAVTRRLRLVSLLDCPVALSLRQTSLQQEPPFIVLEANEALDLKVPVPVAEAVTQARTIAGALADAHRLGLNQGRLGPSCLRRSRTGALKLDFTGLDVHGEPAGPWAEVDKACLAPEPAGAGALGASADIYGLGVLLRWLLTGGISDDHAGRERLGAALAGLPPAAAGLVRTLLQRLQHPDPDERPGAEAVAGMLAQLVHSSTSHAGFDTGTIAASLGNIDVAPTDVTCVARSDSGVVVVAEASKLAATSSDDQIGRRLGRFQLEAKLGQGGMGAVYRALDPADGRLVAVKVLRPELVKRAKALRRFHKEARLLAEANNPFVTNLLEVNEDQGTHYLVMELVDGVTLGQHFRQHGKLAEAEALHIMASVARGLAAAHDRNIIHRDVKPDNILLMRPPGSDGPFQVKLSDFGLARHVVETESLELTQDGAVLGTPLYIAPEQSNSETVGPPADIYALGATLFHMLAGRPPFVAGDTLSLLAKHASEPPPPLSKYCPQVSEAVCRLVDRTLVKDPAQRYADAGALLHDLERLLRGEPTDGAVHPLLPQANADDVLRYDFVWELESAPRELWPHVSNTERLNRAIGLNAVQFTERPPDAGAGTAVRRFGEFRKMGMTAAWEEHPFEWIEGRRMGVLREYQSGPFEWFVSIVELAARAAGGTTLTHRLRLMPRGLLGRTVAAVEVNIRGRRALDRVYRRIDAFLSGKLGSRATADPFEEPAALPTAQRRRLDHLLDRLTAAGAEPAVVERLGDFLGHAPAQEVARIRPLALARRLGVEPDRLVAACLHGAREGLLVLLWDILCPVCRIPSEVKDTLRVVREHGRCEACNLDFALDFANSVEMIFRVHPEVRSTDLQTYCIGGPAHSPHVAAQVRVSPRERTELDLALAEGGYRLRGPQLPYSFEFRVQAMAALARWDLDLRDGPGAGAPRALRAGRQLLSLDNRTDCEIVVRIERTAPRDDALTAARASSLALFRALFPHEVLAPGQLVNVATVTLLVTDLDAPADFYAQLGDAEAFALLHEHFRILADGIQRGGGALVKTVGEGVLAVFSEAASAVETALDLPRQLAAATTTHALRLRIGIHRGPALAATLNDHLDYFGATVRQALHLPSLVPAAGIVLTPGVAGDPQVTALLSARKLEGRIVEADLGNLARVPLLHLRIK